MTILEFIRQCGCTCGDRDDLSTFTLPSGQRVHLLPRVECHTISSIPRGWGRRPRIARRRRPWLRARRIAMRRTGKPPEVGSTTFVTCSGCGARGKTAHHLDGAF